MNIKIINHSSLGEAEQAKLLSQQIRPLYETAFPKEERRAWADVLFLLDEEQNFSLQILLLQENAKTEFLGFISLWDLSDEWLFVEHFALLPEWRNNGFGAKLLNILKETYPSKAILLESEPPISEVATRRLNFYARQGFSILSTTYKQPSYYPNEEGDLSEPLSLYLLGTRACSTDELSQLIAKLYALVYRAIK